MQPAVAHWASALATLGSGFLIYGIFFPTAGNAVIYVERTSE
jgi:hypothetical protein